MTITKNLIAYWLSISYEVQRRGRDSNPRYGCPHNGFRDRHNRPLCHLSVGCRAEARAVGMLLGRPGSPFGQRDAKIAVLGQKIANYLGFAGVNWGREGGIRAGVIWGGEGGFGEKE